nr:B168 [uncultured bacterium]
MAVVIGECTDMISHLDEQFQNGETRPETPQTLVAEAYRQLRTDIIEGRLKPGERLRTEHLKDTYQVGATTLREALAMLISDTLVVSRQQRGFRVAPMSLSDFEDITETRAMLEAHAVGLSIRHGDDDWEARLLGAFHLLSRAEAKLHRGETDVNEWENCNRRFHEVLIAQCGSRWTRHFLSILYHQSERYRRLALVNAPADRDLHQEHTEIFEAAINRDADRASALVEQHVRRTLQVLQAGGYLDDKTTTALKRKKL